MSGKYGSKKVFVTGADGFIGSHLVEKLVDLGAEVTALSLYNSYDSLGWLDDLEPTLLKAIKIIRGDVRDLSLMQELIKGQDIVFHLAALISIPYSYKAVHSYIDTNVTGTVNIFEAAKYNEVEKIVHTSTSEVYGSAQFVPITEEHPYQGQSPYSASKIAADMMAQAYARSFNLPVVILRPFNTYGPRQSERAVLSTIIRQLLDPQCEFLQLGDMTTYRDFNFVNDTVNAFVAVGIEGELKYGTPYNTGSGRKVSIQEVFNLLTEITQIVKPIRQDIERMRPETSEVKELLASSTLLQSATTWKPETSLETGLTRTVDWWKSQFDKGQVRVNSNFVE